MTKTKNPPKSATLTEQLRWYLRHADESPVEVSRQIGVHHGSLYRFLGETRGLSHDAQNRLAKHLKLHLVRDKR